MSGLLVFGGTSEGRILCERLSQQGVCAHVFTATPYGGSQVQFLPHLMVHARRLNASEMRTFMVEQNISKVIDATHPYAKEATLNIQAASAASGAQYIRVLREERQYQGTHWQGIHTVENTAQAVDFLTATEGAILLTTGSKELDIFCTLPEHHKRLYVRVLPMPEALQRCYDFGFNGEHIIAMQGPFSYELNVALLRQLNCKYLVTKNAGSAGGMDEKVAAAVDTGVQVLIIGRPLQETGLALKDVLQLLGLSTEGLEFPAVAANASQERLA